MTQREFNRLGWQRDATLDCDGLCRSAYVTQVGRDKVFMVITAKRGRGHEYKSSTIFHYRGRVYTTLPAVVKAINIHYKPNAN